MASHLHQLKHEHGLLGFQYRYKPYVIGFNSNLHAAKVRDNIGRIQDIWMPRTATENVKNEVNIGLQQLNIDIIVPDVTVETNVLLHIPKKIKNIDNVNLTIEKVDYGQFMLLPFNKYIGIVIANELFDETDEQFIFSSDVVDPCETPFLFARSLGK